MLICRKPGRKPGDGDAKPRRGAPKARQIKTGRKLGEGGPVFLPRRKPSAFAEALLAQEKQVTAYDDAWFAGRPTT